jgi:tetratricopeptide (TPR) repeat protein
MSKSDYLLEATEEAQLMSQKIRHLIESGEKSNVDLALQLLEAGGVPPTLLTYMAVLAIFYPKSVQIRCLAKDLWENSASPEALLRVGDLRSSFYRPSTEKDMRIQLLVMKSYEVFDINDLANLTFQLTGLGAGFCLSHQTRPTLAILNDLIKENSLDLSNFQLDYLPNEVCELTELTYLNVSHNRFTQLPQNIGNLQQLKYLHFQNTPIDKAEKQRLKKVLPRVVAQEKFDQGKKFYNSKQYPQALNAFGEATNLSPNFASAWNWKGYCHKFLNNHTLSRVCFEKSIELDAYDGFAWANLAESVCTLGDYELALTICHQALQKFKHLHQKTSQNEANLWFIKGLAHFWRAEYDQSIQANDACIALNNYAGAWYNKACSYSKQKNKAQMLRTLEKTLSSDHKYRKLVSVDKDRDFEDYYLDPDFRALKEKYSINDE